MTPDSSSLSALTQYRDRTVLVLGGTGFLGRWIVHWLDRAGARVHITVRHGVTLGTRSVTVHDLDATRPESVSDLLERLAPTIVFNAIGYGVDPDEKRQADRVRATQLNSDLPATVVATMAGLEADPSWSGQRVVHVGSILEYGPIGGRLPESAVAQPVGLYAETKLAGTLAVRRVALETGLRAITARVPQLYGPGEHGGRLLPMLAEAAVTGQLPVLSQGTQPKDFVYVSDAAEGLLRLGLASTATPGECVNLATGQLTMVRDFTLLAARVLRLPRELLRFERPVPPGEIVHDPTAVERLRTLTGWAPPTALHTGIERTFGSDSDVFLIRPTTET